MLPYRRCVAIFVKNQNDGSFLICERSDFPGNWQIPQGGIDVNESPSDAAKRELMEETGITSVQIVKNTFRNYKYDFNKKNYANNPKIKKIRGQEVTFFLMDFLGNESEINLSLSMDGVYEFANWRWTTIDDLLNSIVDFKKTAFLEAAIELQLI